MPRVTELRRRAGGSNQQYLTQNSWASQPAPLSQEGLHSLGTIKGSLGFEFPWDSNFPGNVLQALPPCTHQDANRKQIAHTI